MILADYNLNKTSISKKYCENKAKPKMHCDGKCHLKKQLKKEEKKEQAPNSKESKEKFESLTGKDFSYSFKIPDPLNRKSGTAYFFSLISSSPQGLLQPPKC
jgi:hypothetical protein